MTATIQFDAAQLDHMEHWITERECIRGYKERGTPPPWTTDAVLRDNRFCNVRRMDDKVSMWLLHNWYQPLHRAEPGYVVAVAVLARHINWIPTLDMLTPWVATIYGKFDHKNIQRALEDWKCAGNKVFTGVYIINGGRGGSKINTVVTVANTAYDAFNRWDQHRYNRVSLHDMHEALQAIPGVGSFMAGQITADLRHTRVLSKAHDYMAWAPRGPGSTRGMNRLLLRDPLGSAFSGSAWSHHMATLYRVLYARTPVRRVFDARGIELMDVQNCLCEFDKYMRVSTGAGRARNKYAGIQGSLI